ncbi:hypothetical protein QUA20_25140 [Microcoleus sp. Pol7_A1]|uniref:hypothetical protein n=1 Tax=Microcoleus sp. Pol7_A1 TaxID=2818893 RepID=UPI002FD79C7B
MFEQNIDYFQSKSASLPKTTRQTPEELAAEFAIARQLRPNLKVAVFHATLSVDSTEKLEDSEENDQRGLAISVFVSDSGANNAVREEVIAKVALAAWDEWSK